MRSSWNLGIGVVLGSAYILGLEAAGELQSSDAELLNLTQK